MCAFAWPTSHGRPGDAQSKQRYEPVCPNRFAFGFSADPSHSGLMIQPKVGIPSSTSFCAPVNSRVATGSTAKMSSVSRASTSVLLLNALSSRSATSLSSRP